MEGVCSTMSELNQGLVLIPRITILYSIKNTRTCTFTNKLFSTLNSESFEDNTALRKCLTPQTKSTDLWNCLFAKCFVLKQEVLVSTISKNYNTLLYEKYKNMYFQ